jgi:hypothetical protein
MLPATVLIEQSGQLDLLSIKRKGSVELKIDDQTVMLRDQAPLHQGNLLLPAGYTFANFIQRLNGRVFFWPGTSSGPISYGLRHFERYKADKPVILRVQSLALIQANLSVEPLYCFYNSGSPRCSGGQKSPRGPDTFLKASQFPRRASQVVEITFNGEITLPPGSQFGYAPAGPWKTLL